MTPNAPAPVAAAVERKRRRDSAREIARVSLVVMQLSSVGRQNAQNASTDLGRLCDGSITKRRLQGPGRAQLRARPLQVLRHAHQQRLAVGHGVVELLECDIESGQRAFLDGALLEAVQRIAQDTVSL